MEQLTFDFSEPSRKMPGYSGRVYKDRPCDGCGSVYTPRASCQRRCEACQAERDRAAMRDRSTARRRVAREARYCADCGAELPTGGRGRPFTRCAECGPAVKAHGQRRRNRERVTSGVRKSYDAEWRRKNPDLVRASSRKYRAAHPETDKAAIHRRRMRSQVGTDEIDRLLSRLYRKAIRNDPCFYCGSPDAREVDHFFPLSKGGAEKWLNLVSACRQCNRGANGKGATCGTAFMLRRGLGTAALRPAA